MNHTRSILGVFCVSFLLGCGADGDVGTPSDPVIWKSCTLIGCEDSASLDQTFSAGTADLQKLELLICRKDQCETLAVKWSAAQPNQYDCRGPGRRHCFLAQKKDGTLWLLMDFVAPPGEDLARYFQDGDRYRVRVQEPGQTPLFALDQSVKYHWFYPNGPDCDPGCRGALLTPSIETARGPALRPKSQDPSGCRSS